LLAVLDALPLAGDSIGKIRDAGSNQGFQALQLSRVKPTECEKFLEGRGVHQMLRGGGEIALRFMPNGKGYGRYKPTKLEHIFKIDKRGNLGSPIVDD
jgi:hypothetical protein